MSETDPGEGSLGEREFRAFAQLIHQASGVRLGDEKREFLAARLRPLARRLGLTFPRLLRAVRSDDSGEKLALLLDRVTTNTTGFFRHPEHFDLLRRELTALRVPRGKLRIWSAGCSTGEEPYSVALVLVDAGLARDAKVLATDLSQRALRMAREATFDSEAVAQVPPGLRRHLEQLPDGAWRPREAVRAIVHLRRHDLRDVGSGARSVMDAVFCRNVLIYFAAAERARVVERLSGALRPGGIFFLGPSETGIELPPSFERIGPAAYRKR